MRHELPNLPTLPPGERERIRLTREALVGGGVLSAPPGDTGVPQYIEMSWRRCVGESVPMTGTEIEYREPEDAHSVLGRAAAPVLDRLKDSFADVPVAMVVSDATGRIVMRHVDLDRQRMIMDRARAAEGFDFSEESVGTNGIGTVLVERTPVLVRGPEHYNELLEDLTCAGTPIFEPYSGRLVGTFSLACAVGDVNPLMPVLARDIGRQIESRILEEAGDRHRRLAQAYLSVDRAKGAALVVDEETVLANRLGLRHTGPELHAMLWPFLDERAPPRPPPCTCPWSTACTRPSSSRSTTAAGAPTACGCRPAGHATAGRSRRAARPLGTALDGGPRSAALPSRGRTGSSRPWCATARWSRWPETAAPASSGRHCAPWAGGEPGSPWSSSRTWTPGGSTPPRRPPLEAAAWSSAGSTRRPRPRSAQMQALLSSGAPVAVTVDLDAADDGVAGLVRQVATTVRLPALQQSREYLPAVVRAILAELPEPRSRTRISPAAWERLTAWHWPGNLAELRNTVHGSPAAPTAGRSTRTICPTSSGPRTVPRG